jgi:hypothetical protein
MVLLSDIDVRYNRGSQRSKTPGHPTSGMTGHDIAVERLHHRAPIPGSQAVPTATAPAPVEISSPTPAELLHELAAGKAARTLEDLALCFDTTEQALAAPLATLVGDGQAELWAEAPDGPSVVLSALAAARLGLVVAVEADTYVPRGSRAADLESSKRAAYSHETNGHEFTTWTDDRVITPDRLVMVAERYAGIRARVEAEALGAGEPTPQRPTEWQVRWCILGLAPSWPVQQAPGKPCRGCGGRPLRGCCYCALCDRSSWDNRLQSVSAPLPRRGPRVDRLMGGV